MTDADLRLKVTASKLATEHVDPHIRPDGFMAFDEYCETIDTVELAIRHAAEGAV